MDTELGKTDLIKYLGSKRLLLNDIVGLAAQFPAYHSVLDLFSGTSRVGHAFKQKGYRVISNDHNAYAHTLATCYVKADKEKYERDAQLILNELATLSPVPGYFTETFCVRSRFFQPHNGEIVDAMRERIETLDLDPVLKAVVLVSLMEAADRVDSTTGVQMAYLKGWAKRSFNQLELRMPALVSGSPYGACEAHNAEAQETARAVDVDIAYLDPPYNQHSYLGNYHIWESLVLWDKPEVYGIACKRIDCRQRSSVFNSKKAFTEAFRNLLCSLNSKLIIVSFNNEGYLDRNTLESMLNLLGEVKVFDKEFKRYVGAQIGIYNPSGQVVGEVSHLKNKELIYVCDTVGNGAVEQLAMQSDRQASLFA